MRVNYTRTTVTAAALLGLSMGTLVVGFSLFLMPAPVALATPQTWIFATITAAVVTLLTARPFNPVPASRRGHDVHH